VPTLRDGSKTSDVKLDRLVHFDPKSRNYPVSDLLPAPPKKHHVWRLQRARMGNQMGEGACIEFGVTHVLAALPAPAALAPIRLVRDKHLFYWPAQVRDPWPGGSYPGADPVYEGTSTLAVLQVAKELGFFGAYHWAFTVEQVVQGILTVGPAVLGLNWRTGMVEPGSDGLIEATGPADGGHCVAGIGIDHKRFADGRVLDVVVIAQSWGPAHGDRGRVYLPLDQLAELLADQGECAFVTERAGLHSLPVAPSVA
jgi:hypothetical protein